MEIEKARFDERLEVEYDIDDTLMECRILPLTIQPLVENAIRHGIMKRKQGGKLQLIIREAAVASPQAFEASEKMLIVTIRDNGVGMSQGKITEVLDLHRTRAKRGVGLVNIHQRLMLLYREGLHIESNEGEGTIVQFRFKCSKQT
ncbi:ATP-binding protein [Paenibacillus barengoltzii]|uniref:sensor histidine kinase n=1 Tax=Paenibacillus barengoltzii TaxID=343517 RepID=UPI002DB64C21|nr:ATP-binding protein [Paenibacillus barengoltzii]MEC2343099.1 ATP-binding protein [Paenibacillus barengoltzii]